MKKISPMKVFLILKLRITVEIPKDTMCPNNLVYYWFMLEKYLKIT